MLGDVESTVSVFGGLLVLQAPSASAAEIARDRRNKGEKLMCGSPNFSKDKTPKTAVAPETRVEVRKRRP